MPLTEDEERAEYDLRMEVMQLDKALKAKQGFWETPRNLAIVVGAVAALCAAIFGTLGYKLGSQPQQIIVHLDAPLVVQPAVKP
jgi:hypothetical protein